MLCIYRMKIGRVYKIIAAQGTECYVGSTFNTTRDRFQNHKGSYHKWLKEGRNKGCSLFDLFEKHGVENCRMILIKEYDVLDRQHLEVYETLWIKKLKAINKIDPSGGLLKRTRQKQYRETNRDKISEYNKLYREQHKESLCEYFKTHYETNRERIRKKYQDYYEDNKEQIKEMSKKYYDTNKEAIKSKRRPYHEKYRDREVNRDRYKQWREENKERTKEYKKIYYEANRESINQKKKHTIECDCGRQVTAVHLARHKKTKRHLDLMNAKGQ